MCNLIDQGEKNIINFKIQIQHKHHKLQATILKLLSLCLNCSNLVLCFDLNSFNINDWQCQQLEDIRNNGIGG
jgi:hypothetical protein